MAASDRNYAIGGLRVVHLSDGICEDAGAIDYVLRLNVEFLSREFVQDRDPTDLTVRFQQPHQLALIENVRWRDVDFRVGVINRRREQQRNIHLAVVELPVLVDDPRSILVGDVGRDISEVLSVREERKIKLDAVAAGRKFVKQVVHHRTDVVECALKRVSAGNDDRQLVVHVSSVVDHRRALLQRFLHELVLFDAAAERLPAQFKHLLQVTDASVDEFGGFAGGAR